VITRVLIANRGEIAVRIIRACRDMGIETVVAHSEPDRDSLAVQLADRSVCIGPALARESYLNANAVVSAAVNTGCDAVHPGYGFLAENGEFADLCEVSGLIFVGPSSSSMALLGDKLSARSTAARLGVPTVPGATVDTRNVDVAALVDAVGFPMLIKASAGGGGRGLRRVDDTAGLQPALDMSAAEADAAFGDPTLYIERYLEKVRHVEVQVLGDTFGTVVHLFERDCTTQRRYQKLVEESPSPVIRPETRAAMTESACTLARSVGYAGAGTVEFLVDMLTGDYYFIEMNTRLQVEHTVTEQLTGVDLVQMQLLVAGGAPLPMAQSDLVAQGHVIEFRINAEDPDDAFRPTAGTVTRWEPAAGPWLRVDSHMRSGEVVAPYYDSLLGKLIVWGGTREEMLARASRAVSEFAVTGVPTTLGFHAWLLAQEAFRTGELHTTWVDDHWEAKGTS
jgi:acetyl-CoA carboxylase biotin carboxylase subunit